MTLTVSEEGSPSPGSVSPVAPGDARDVASWLATRARTLFPEVPPSSLPRAWIVLGYATAFTLLSALSLLRQSGVAAWNTVWAEDGSVFYQGTFHHSVLGSLTTTFSGYEELLPRMLEDFARLLPTGDLAPFAAIVGATCVSALALFVFHAARGHLPSLQSRIVLVAAMVLLPVATTELLNNLVNLPWWLFFAAFWALVWRPSTVSGRIVAGLVCFLGVGSEPIIALLLPLALFRVLVLRSARENAPTAGLFLGLLFQVMVMIFGSSQPSMHVQAYAPAFRGLPQDFLLRVGLAWLTGSRLTTDFILHSPGAGAALACVALAVLVLLAISAREVRVSTFVVVAMVTAVAGFAVPVWLRGVAPRALIVSAASYGRWAEVPVLLLISALLVSLEGRFGRPGAGRALVSLSVVVLLMPAWLIDFRDSNSRTYGPAWSAQVASARSRCLHDPSPGRTVTLHVSPRGWDVTIPCDKL